MDAKSLLSKPNLKRMISLYRLVLKTNKQALPFYLVGLCDQAVVTDFRHARDHYSNTQFQAFVQRYVLLVIDKLRW